MHATFISQHSVVVIVAVVNNKHSTFIHHAENSIAKSIWVWWCDYVSEPSVVSESLFWYVRHFQLTLELLGKALLSRNLALDESTTVAIVQLHVEIFYNIKLGGDFFSKNIYCFHIWENIKVAMSSIDSKATDIRVSDPSKPVKIIEVDHPAAKTPPISMIGK